jgi:hypothetical protein
VKSLSKGLYIVAFLTTRSWLGLNMYINLRSKISSNKMKSESKMERDRY